MHPLLHTSSLYSLTFVGLTPYTTFKTRLGVLSGISARLATLLHTSSLTHYVRWANACYHLQDTLRRAFRNPPAPLRGTSVLNSDQDRFYQIPEPPPLPPALQDTGGRLAYLASCCRSFFNQNFQSKLDPILMRFCLQLGLQNPPKIHPKSISRVS